MGQLSVVKADDDDGKEKEGRRSVTDIKREEHLFSKGCSRWTFEKVVERRIRKRNLRFNLMSIEEKPEDVE